MTGRERLAPIPARGRGSDRKLAQTGGSRVGLAGGKTSFLLTCSEVSHVRLGICAHARRSCLRSGVYITPLETGVPRPQTKPPLEERGTHFSGGSTCHGLGWHAWLCVVIFTAWPHGGLHGAPRMASPGSAQSTSKDQRALS